MSIKLLFRTAVAALLLTCAAVAASAQSQPVTGRVTIKQADGAEAPVKDALVDFYQTDIARKFLGIKTDKSGGFRHAGLPLGIYTIIVSAPNARPAFLTDVRITQRPEIPFVLEPGDGKRLTLDDVKALRASGGTAAAAASGAGAAAAAKATAESKEAREKRLAEEAKIKAGNEKIVQSNEVVKRTFTAGNAALEAKNYDEAIRQYEEGLTARDETALFANRSEAYRRRGVERYNAAIKTPDESAKAAALEMAFKDWRTAAESANKAVEMLKTQTQDTADPAAKANQEQNKLAAYSTRAEAMRLLATKVDKTQADAAYAAYEEYIQLQPDPAKKSKLRADAVKILFDANAYPRAVEEYRKILVDDPDNLAANLYLGFSLFNTGDKSKFQEAANYIGRYVEKAPEGDATKVEAKSILDFLKTQENIKPEKIQTVGPARRRRG